MMIPKVKNWKVNIVETGEIFEISTITKKMVGIIMKIDYPKTWGKTLKISLKRK